MRTNMNEKPQLNSDFCCETLTQIMTLRYQCYLPGLRWETKQRVLSPVQNPASFHKSNKTAVTSNFGNS